MPGLEDQVHHHELVDEGPEPIVAEQRHHGPLEHVARDGGARVGVEQRGQIVVTLLMRAQERALAGEGIAGRVAGVAV
jgi:hypothetical protein